MNKTIITGPQVTRSDDRGDFIQVTQGEFKQLSLIKLNKGSFRGKHYHKKTREGFYLVSGRIRLDNFDLVAEEKEELVVEENNFFIIEPYVYHNIVGLEDSLLVVLPDKAFDPTDEDIYSLSAEKKKEHDLD